MGVVCLAGGASEDGRGGLMAVSPARSARKVEIRIYRCCPNCGKGDTPLSNRQHCEVCGSKLPQLSGANG
jgi:uncharacterized protein (DUF983 family)